MIIDGLGPQNFYNILNHQHEHSKDWVVVNWNLGNMCNFSCSYCPSILNDGSFGWNDYEVIESFINNVIDYYYQRKIYFEFTGGEVTLWRDFIKVAKYIKNKGHDIGFISNGSRTIRWWEKNKSNFDHVCLSFHPEEGDPEHFLEVTKIMSSQCRTHINIMMHTDMEKFNIAKKLAHDSVQQCENISIALQPLVVDFGTERFPYTQDQLDVIDGQYKDYVSKIKHTTPACGKLYRGSMIMIDDINNLKQGHVPAHHFIANNQNNWKGWDCWAGVEQFIVDFDGTLWRGWCRVGGAFGTIHEPDKIKFPSKPVLCNKSYCHCNFDIMCKKVLSKKLYEVIDDE